MGLHRVKKGYLESVQPQASEDRGCCQLPSGARGGLARR